ncbi:MAG: tetratricopeptide repeat protein [Steroidobacter sp.]
MRARLIRVLAAAVIATAALPAVTYDASAEPLPAHANTVIGANAMLSDGAAALMSGEWERGVQLTRLGLDSALSQSDRAAAYANLCAGYAALKKYQRALENCDQSLAIYDGNWRAWQNRAAAHLGLGKVDESMRDIQRGLQINPDSQDLQKTLAIARDYERLQQERMRHLLES